ncbi:glycosyltransferase family A protein [Lutibacter maritimus]|uniref:Glycosyl transferase family 2 n=1 Tax=Lutibacter maritimus TaxID=593133 RepID=A0A1I6SP00_9FLAO|nr:glycosyltransferase family A protein [Lutibacter maritimus]SFS78528.1 Glycosyl transferase family 2 [Lutibacter maritimus]
MRIGNHPYKDKELDTTKYTHQIIVPVYIPNEDGYFKDAFKIFNYCLQSLITTVHSQTFITIVNNGSNLKVINYLNELLYQQKIHELIHTENIGKLNAILKGLAGNNIDLVTITDADVLFKPNWQQETYKVFNTFTKAGVVGLIPQFKMFELYCGNVLFDTFFSKKVQFTKVKSKDELAQFYKSIGWEPNYNPNYLQQNLSITHTQCTAIIGAGHVVATYKKELFETIKTYIGAKMGANSEGYLDKAPLYKGLWRLTTEKNMAYHMGNVVEPWMEEVSTAPTEKAIEIPLLNTYKSKKNISSFLFFIKNRLFGKLFSNSHFKKLYYRYKKLPKEMIQNY